ncbi:MAG: hypothetical protein A4E65_03512 [Syntrophorhabdus sp. PtaU1.Bin153]|nr:MAG: hypothetical protein A4E65_03512 [Syntrophorhabdus sp. PtaU1.Bin153]
MGSARAVTGLASNTHFAPLALEGLSCGLVDLQDAVAGGMAGGAVTVPVVLVPILLPFARQAVELFIQQLEPACLAVLNEVTLLPPRTNDILHIIELNSGTCHICRAWTGILTISGPLGNRILKDSRLPGLNHLAMKRILPTLIFLKVANFAFPGADKFLLAVSGPGCRSEHNHP